MFLRKAGIYPQVHTGLKTLKTNSDIFNAVRTSHLSFVFLTDPQNTRRLTRLRSNRETKCEMSVLVFWFCNGVWTCWYIPTFRRNMMPPSSSPHTVRTQNSTDKTECRRDKVRANLSQYLCEVLTAFNHTGTLKHPATQITWPVLLDSLKLAFPLLSHPVITAANAAYSAICSKHQAARTKWTSLQPHRLYVTTDNHAVIFFNLNNRNGHVC
jgi:hypothetical protein